MLRRGFNHFHGTFSCLHTFRSLIPYSTSVASNHRTSNPLMVELLVNSVGYSDKEAVSIATKVSRLSKSTEKSELVLSFLKNSGFDESHIRKVVKSAPNVLHIDIEKTLKPKFRVLQELGFTGPDLVLLVSQNPCIILRSVKDHIIPTLEMLKPLFGGNEQLVKVILSMKSQRFLSNNVVKYLPNNLLLLQSYGVPSERIRWFLLSRTHSFLSQTQWFAKAVKGVEEKLRIPRTSRMFLHGVHVMCSTSEDKIGSHRQLFQSYGLSDSEYSELLRRYPMCLTLSEKGLRVKLKYLMEDHGFKGDSLISHLALLSYSMEKRILPRTAVMQTLKYKKLLKKDISLAYFSRLGESKFLEKYVLPFKDRLPGLYESYTHGNVISLSLSET